MEKVDERREKEGGRGGEINKMQIIPIENEGE